MAENEGGSEQDDVSFLRTEDMVCLSCNATGERVCLAAEGFGNRTCFLEGIADRNKPPDLAACVFVIEQALSVRALQELVTAAASDTGKGTGSGHRTLLYGNAVLLRHQNSDMYLACLSTSSSKDKLAFDVGLQEHCQGEACWWTIHPASKQRSEGEKVRVGDDLILVSVATERYLQATLENEVPIVNASFHVTHWSVSPFGTGLSRVKYVGYLFGGEVLRFFHGGDECLTIPSNWSEEDSQNIVVYEGGSVVSQARSLWRLELARTKWSGGYINWFHPMRIRHITTGRYLGINEHNEITLVHRSDSSVASTTFYLREEKDDNKVMLEDKDLEVIGTPLIKYGDSTVIVQHIESGLWLSYKAFETKKKGVGKVEVKQAILHEEGKMDDGLEFSRSQDEESRTARVIRKCSSLFTKFTKQLDQIRTSRRHSVMLSSMNLKEIVMCLEDLINYFAQPDAEMEHEERQIKLRALRNRQDLCQEEGILNLILDAIDKITVITSEGYLVSLAGEESGQMWDIISNYLYQLLAAMIKGNHNNCAQFANSMRLNWLFSRLGSQAGGEGMLDVLHCVLIDSPEALNVMKEEHIKVIISILEKHGRDPKVLDVLRSLCVGNGVAVRSSQNNICDYLLPGKSLLLQTALVDHVSSVHPNIYVGKVQGSSMYLKWYYEVTVDHIEQASHMPPHLRMGWANTMGYIPYPGGGEKWGGNGVGDDLYSFGFDGAHLWTGGRKTEVFRQEAEPYIRKNDVIGVMLDLTVPSIEFTFNGEKVMGCFRDFNLDGMFFPVISCSSKLSARFLLGGDHGRQKFEPPEGFSPVSECLLPAQQMSIDPCFHFGELAKGVLAGPLVEQEDPVFVPQPIDTSAVTLPHYVEQIRDRLAENIHEIWAMNKIDEGWRYGEERDDEYMLHPCLTQFERLPPAEKRYDVQLALQTLKTIVKLGYHITLDKPPNRIRSIRLPNDPFMQSNGYKPAPLDLSQVALTGKLEELVEKLAENTHMVWSKERIQQGWTYGLNEDMEMIRTPHLVPYRRVDEAIKKANRDTASEAVRTLLVYGYILDPPSEQHDEGPADDLLNGRANYRTYRAEKTYAVSSGKWYFEFEVLTDGPMKVGWARIDAHPGRQIGQDDSSWAFDGYHAHKHHSSQMDHLGRKWHVGDVVGCMLDLHDRTISFSLNGELMMDAMGGETAFSEVVGDAFVPACTLGLSQRTRLAFGHDVNALKFFTQCGLQEGYEPFCVNMTRPMTFWYTKDQPIFENVDEVENSPIDVTRIPAGSDSPPCLRISHATFETLEKANWEFLRLSLPVTCQTVFIDEAEKERRWHEIRVRQHRLRHEGRNRPPSALKQSMLESGFTMNDIQGLQNGYDAVEADEVLMNKEGEKTTPAIPRRGSKMARAASEMDIQRGRAAKEKTPLPGEKKKERGKSPFRFFKKRDQSTDRLGGKRGKSQDRVIPTLELPNDRGQPLGALGAGGSAVRLSQADMRLMPPSIPDRLTRQRLSIANGGQPPPVDGEQTGDDIGTAFDAECLRLINEYYYGVRIFPGQDPAHVYVGWVTTQYHIHGTTFSQQAVRKVTVAQTDGYGSVGDSVDRHSCYMVRADDLLSEVSADASGKGASQGMSIGVFIDTSTGVIAFTCEGKETNIKFKMEPGVKLFPAVFVEATSKDVLQIELGRTPTSLPLSAAVLQSSEKHVVPQFPPRLKFQLLKPHQWARVPNQSLRVHALKLSDIRGWSIYCEDPVPMLALHIPEEDRCIDILELIEHERLLSFHAHTLELYCAVCFQSNYRGAHILCHHVDDKQLLYAIRAEYMSGPLRRGFYDLLIAVHMESHANTMEVTSNEYVIPLGPDLKQLYEEPGMSQSLSVQTTMSVQPELATLPVCDPSVSGVFTMEKVNELAMPYFDFETVRVFVMEALKDAYVKNQVHTRDSIGGSNETLFVPLLKLCDRLLLVGYLRDEDIQDLLVMIDHASWDPSFEPEGKDQHRRGLLQIKMAEGCKLQICYLLHHLYDIQLRHRVESIVAFSHDYVGELQRDQLRRYVEIKQSELPSSVTARKTKEFRCPPREQMNSILSFKNLENIDPDDVSVGDDLIQQMKGFHEQLMKTISIVTKEDEEENAESNQPKSMSSTFLSVIGLVKQAETLSSADDAEEQSPEDKFRRVLVPTIVRWAEESFIEDSKLIREMFRLLLRQYNAVGELMKALEKTYVINAKTSVEVASLWNFLSKIRALLPVQMSPEEEELVRKLLWSLVNNHVFFQHPDLVRILRIHENVMAIMMNTLARRSQAENESASTEAESKMAHEQMSATKDTSHEMVVACCRFLCYFCRTSRQNQKAMFDHLQFLLENSNILLSRPSLRGSTPLDVSYSSLMDNTELALALREHYLEKIAVYLSRCGLQSNSELVAKGYPDIGWDPVEGERYLDFLRFCVWVGGESVEENANLVIRLLIRRPECLGPALRGEGEGLLNAINQANKMAERIDAQNNGAVEADGGAFSSHPRPLSDDDEDYINTGAAILNFYCTLVDVMGRSSPEEFLIEQGKNESLRARAILRSLVPLSDLEGVLSLPFTLRDGEGEDNTSSDMPAGLIPSHKQSVVLFLERVYGIEDRELFFRLLEFAFLPDLRAATVLDKSDGGESDMGLALNRYIGNSILPLLIKHSRFYADADNYSSLLDATLHTVYRLSKNKILTKGQREAVSDFLVTLTRELHPGMMLKLLRKLTVDVSNITEYTTVALRLLTLHYDRCGRYYGSPNGQGAYGCASEEEKRLTMILFSNIFDSLAKMEYDPDLFGNALPCLTAIGCALPPDYSLTTGYEDELFRQSTRTDAKYIPQPIDTSTVALTKEMTDVIQKFSDHYHDAWASRKLENGWFFGDEYNRDERTHPRLKPPYMLSEYERERYREPVRQALTALLALGWTVEYGEADTLSPKGSIRRSSSRQDVPPMADSRGGGGPADYNPQPVDMTNLTLSREMQNMAERLAENAHDIWAKKTKHELEASAGASAHPMMVPYDLLTDKEKRKDRERCQELLKYLQFQGYKLARARTSRSDSETQEKAAAAATERRFAYSLLEKLQQYLGSAALNMKVLVPSQNLGHRVSFKRPSRDVKFFFKVVLPLMEKYFSTNRSYFIAVPTVTNMVGAASLKEKEMVANVFCKLAHLLRMKMSSFSSDTRLAVRCLTVLVRAVDARSLAKQCPEFVRTSMLTFFNHAAEDVGTTVQHLQEEKYSYIRGTHLKTSSCLNYVQLVLFPVLTAFFDHLVVCEYGTDLLLDEIQVACYKLFHGLYQLGTDPNLSNQRKFIKAELDRHRPSLGTCLGAFAACFPVAFLEPDLNKYNQYSIHGRLQERSLEAQEVMARLEAAVPTLEEILKMVEKFAESGGKYDEARHIVDSLLPMLCSYLPFWWSQGPDNAGEGETQESTTRVTDGHMNQLLKNILHLIKSNIGSAEAPWMTRIAGYAQQIIVSCSPDLLYDPYLPLAEKVRRRTEAMYHKEENLRGFLKSTTEDTSQVEGQLQEMWYLLVRDIYAFYPLLIKYVDLQRSHWLKDCVPEAEDLYNHVAVIFEIWSKSQYFTREETNFISQNEIDNMTLIRPTTTARRTTTAVSEPSAGRGKKKKKRGDKKKSKDKDVASSLMVACLKRLLPVGLNLFAGREQEMVQHAKDRYLKGTAEYEIIETTKAELTMPDRLDPTDSKSWQHHLYSKLGGGARKAIHEHDKTIAEKVPTVQDIVQRIVDMAKVLYGLHMAFTKASGKQTEWKKMMSTPRKMAVLKCLRSTPMYNVARHRAVNLFLQTYSNVWLSDENSGQEVLIEDLTQSFEDSERNKKTTKEEDEEESPDPVTQLVTMFSRQAQMEQGPQGEDTLYMDYAVIMAKSCGEEEEEGGDDEEGEEGGDEGDTADAMNEQEIEKQKLLFCQDRLSSRGVAEMVLLNISASKGQPSEMTMKSLDLGISILRGGNVDVQMAMLNYLKEKKDSSFFVSISGLMSSCSVLDLDAFERNTKAEGLGVGSEGAAGEKNMHDDVFTCAVFRFLQLTCEGHNLDWQNYLRTQAGNTTTVNLVICTVDYLLRLQESIMDFYWHYSSKEIIDQAGKSNFFKAIGVASQVFNTLTEVIQGPCVGNQQALAHSRLWDAVGGFLFLFSHMQDKLSRHASQVDLLRELLNLQQDMIIMMLSMLEGNVVNGTIGKQMVDTLVESASNVEMILKFFDMFLKLKDLTESTNFQDIDQNNDGMITPKEFKDKMEQTKAYTSQEINFLIMCCDENHDGKIDYLEFTERFHNPAKEIGFNLAVLLTNLSEHMPNDPRLARFLETAGSVLNYFEPLLGRIEILGSNKKIERVYFEIKQEHIEQWEKPQIKQSKRDFFYQVVTEGGDKEKLELFVNFCEDAIFEMQHATSLMGEEEDAKPVKSKQEFDILNADEEEKSGMDLVKSYLGKLKDLLFSGLSAIAPANLKRRVAELRRMTVVEILMAILRLGFSLMYYTGWAAAAVIKYILGVVNALMQGERLEKPPEKKEDDVFGPMTLAVTPPPPPTPALPLPEPTGSPPRDAMLMPAGKMDESGREMSEPGATPAEGAEAKATEEIKSEVETAKEAERREIEKQQAAVLEEKEETGTPTAAAEPAAVAQVDLSEYMHRVVSFLARNFYNLKYIALVLAFCINFMLLFYKASALLEDGDDGDEETVADLADQISGSGSGSGELDIGGSGDGGEAGGGDDDEEDGPEWIHVDDKYFFLEHVVRLMSIIHSIVSLFMLVAYYHLKVPLGIFKREKEVCRKLEFDGLYLASQPEDDDLMAHWDKLVISAKMFPANYWDKFVKKRVRQKYSDSYDFDQISNLLGMEKSVTMSQQAAGSGFFHFITSIDWRYQLWKIGVTFTDNAFLYSLWYFVFSILGNYNYFFFAAHLLDVAVAVPSLKTILQSVTHNGKQLCLTLLLLTIVVYIYTVIAFNFFRKFYVQAEDDNVDQKCHDMFTCFVFHLYQGVRAGGGIGDVIDPPDGDLNEVYRILFDISFFFFVIVILLAIIQGLIIDAFGELRDQLESVKEDMESNCFICGIGKDYFDNVPHGFETHVQKEHNLANYMFFLMHLINKDETEYTGQETYVWTLYQQRSWDFFPVGDCFRKQYEDELTGGGGGS